MTRRASRGLLAAIVLAPAAALSGDPATVDRVAVAVRRRGVEIEARGTATATGLEARVVRGDTAALATPVDVRPDGWRAAIRVERRLLPDEYALEIGPPGKPGLARRTFRIGKPDEVEPARARLKTWLVGARGALRDLSVDLERRGRFHVAQIDALRGQQGSAEALAPQRKAWNQFLGSWNDRLRAARMDFAAYERELALPPFPETGAALGALFATLRARRDAFERAIDDLSRGVAARVAEPTELRTLAVAAGKGLGEAEPDTRAWEPGVAAEPERGTVQGGVFTSPLGFSIDTPQGWTVQPSTLDPDVRVRLSPPGEKETVVLVRVRDLPDAPDDAALEKIAEVSNWEGFTSYKRESGGRLEDGRSGCWRRFTAVQGDFGLVVHQVDLFAPRRLLSVLAVTSARHVAARTPELDKCVASFKRVDR